jgi:rRNA maturation RNase YbeY
VAPESSGNPVAVFDEARLGCGEDVQAAVQAVLDRHAPRPGAVETVLVSDARLRGLNRDYRGLDEETDVLSFPGPDWPGAPLGEIAVSAEHVRQGARRRGAVLAHEAMFLAAHGALHLCGFDDDDEPGRAEMVRLANEALAGLGVEPCPDWESLPHSGAH